MDEPANFNSQVSKPAAGASKDTPKVVSARELFAGEREIGRRGLAYRNREVVAYVAGIRTSYLRQAATEAKFEKTPLKRDMR